MITHTHREKERLQLFAKRAELVRIIETLQEDLAEIKAKIKTTNEAILAERGE